MKDKPEKNSSNVRLPGDLLAELRKETAPYLARGEEPPSFGALLTRAWADYKRNSDENRAKDSEEKEIGQKTDTRYSTATGNVIELTGDEIAWVEKLLKVLRSGHSDFLQAVTSNLLVFANYCEVDTNGGTIHGPDSSSVGATETPAAGGSAGAVGAAPYDPKEALREKVARARKKNDRRNKPETRDRVG